MISMNEFTEGPLTLDEMIKIMSLMENPPEASGVRKALRFYEVPVGLDVKWGHSSEAMKVMRHYSCPQAEEELAWMLQRIDGKTSLLEIGSNFGGTLKRMASVMPKGSKIVSVDLPIDETPKFLNPLATLKDTCRKLSLLGANVHLFVGNSHSREVIDGVRAHAPFEFGFIDGDHTYEGVKQDWENYGPMCKVVGFHDIEGAVEGCTRFWRELKAKRQYRTEEIISAKGPKFGIGIVHREE